MAITRLILLLFISFTVSATSKAKIFTCSSVIERSNLMWPQTSNKSTSKPICINENKEIAFRYCLNGSWGPEPNCSSIQPEVLPECPEGFNDSGDLCYQISKKSKFPPVCPYKNVVPFETYKYLANSTNTPIWVPAQRKNFNFMRWLELGAMYQKEVENYTATPPLLNKNCLIFSENEFVAVSCDDKNVGICAYLKLDRQNTNLCGVNCLQSDFDLSSKCFCYHDFASNIEGANASFEKPYQFTIYKKLTNSICNIGLRKINGTYQWSTGREIGYTFWHKSANFDDENTFGAASETGWTMTKKLNNTCYIFEKEVNAVEPILTLSFNESMKMFYLTVFNVPIDSRPELISQIYCFTNAYGVALFRYNPTIQKFGNNSFIQKIQPVEQPGDYWCEMFNFTNMVKIQSDRIFYRPESHLEFVVYFQLKYAPDENPLRGEFIQLFENFFNSHNISCFGGVNYLARVVKIVNFDEDQKNILLNSHFTSLTATSESEEEQLACLRMGIVKILEVFQNETTLINITSSDYCLSEKGSLTWPTTARNSYASPDEYCFKSDGTPIMRLCNGDFINGAKWSPAEECEIFNTSVITYKLINASGDANPFDEIYEISKSWQDFNVLDVYLVSKMYSEYLYVTNVENFTLTVNNLLRIDKDILREAQEKLGATDRLLHFIDHLTIENQKQFEIYLENFALMVLPAKNFTGVVVENVSGNFSVFKLVDNQTLGEIMQIENLESALFLKPDLKSDFEDEDMVVVAIYFNDKFFPQNSNFAPSVIFHMWATKETMLGPTIICKLKHHDPMQGFCALWKYSRSSFWLKSHHNTEIKYPFALCHFWNFANFAWISSNEESDEVTEDLIDLLESNGTTSEIINKLEQISEEFVKFKAIDVVYTGKILDKVKDKQMDLEKLANTVNNLQQVDRTILAESQIDEKATDRILFEVDSIVQNHDIENQINLITTNFFLFVGEAAQISGVILLDHSGYFELRALTENISIDDIIRIEDFDSAIILDQNLKNQLPTDSKITITLFLTDALFNEEFPKYKYISKIFGVVLPETEFSGPISVLYKHDETDDKNCVYWHYSLTHPGFWEKDGENHTEPDVIKCDFWHATHFAYLILDQTKPYDDTSNYFLDLITSINSLLSLMSLMAIAVTAVLFKQWRKNTGNQILLNFSLTIVIEIVVFYISTSLDHTEHPGLCTAVGIILHYSIISQFCWMLVVAILQFRKFVIVLEAPPKYILLKACSCGWILPIFPVLTVYLFDRRNYVMSQIGLCYPSGLGLYLGVWLPIALIMAINFVLFAITLYNVFHKRTQSFSSGNDVIYQIRLAVLLFFLLGFTWCFGFLAKLECGIVFEYLFCMTVTLQGFILFLVFVAFSDSTRHLYVSSLSKLCKRKYP